jgi:uncharacterized protein YgbK (DUF1537 family)
MALLFGAVADDLTGGVELASMLVAAGIRTSFATSPEVGPPPDAMAHVIALKTRVAPADKAISAVLAGARTLQEAKCRQFFFKYCATFDSTPAGNIGPCSEALLDRLGTAATVFVPTYCEVGRTVYQGHMFAGEQLLSESPKRYDPLTPMTDSNLCRVLKAQSRGNVGLLDHATVVRGQTAIEAKITSLTRAGVALIVCDAIYPDDIRVIAEACSEMVLVTGNSTIAAELVGAWRRRGFLDSSSAGALLPGIEGRAAVLAGSCAMQTAEQIEEYGRTRPVLRLDLERAIQGQDAIALARSFLDAIPRDVDFAICTGVPPTELAALQAKYGQRKLSEVAEGLVAKISVDVVGRYGVRRMAIAGGETAGAVVAALRLQRMTVAPFTIPGFGRAYAEHPHRIGLVLKSGKLGTKGILSESLEQLRHPLRQQASAA